MNLCSICKLLITNAIFSSQIWTAKGYICLLQGTALISSSQNLHKWTEAAFEPHSEQYTTCPQCCRSCSSKSTSCTLWGAPEEFHTKLVSHNSIKKCTETVWQFFVEEVWGHWAMWGTHSPGHARCSRQVKFTARTAPKYKQVFEIHETPVAFASTEAPQTYKEHT